MEITIEQKYKLGEVALHNGRKVRINSFSYEVRPMGNFKKYSYTRLDDDYRANTVEHMLVKID